MNFQENHWIEERRDLFLRNIVRDFLRSHEMFARMSVELEKGRFKYKDLRHWVGSENEKGLMWRLKDLCHLMWGESDPDSDPHHFFLDWMIGAIFHEAMKMKENVYLVTKYRPNYFISKKRLEGKMSQGGFGHGDSHDKCDKFFSHIVDDIRRGAKQIGCMFNEAASRLARVIEEERDNPLMVRFVLENQPGLDRALESVGGAQELLERLFPDGLDKAYCIAGEGYLEGGWYAEARMAFEQAIKENRSNQEARRGLHLLEKRIKEIALLMNRNAQVQLSPGPVREADLRA